ncbi:MAG: glycoside hydrolase family 57 protein [Candidatus Calescibacterium sp.]|nr:glycoside hydrolase family 57 protein [Candidatus Calescibacterium sp.]MCX7733308.1 glycoside hydrolase family 57 protein [bacterium]MDW8086771.1 glycoside hydrolase family 57 protein [Candidatus Calescibacterium sp.]
MSRKLYLVIWWHMHQPLYKDPFSGKYILPWTFLHALKDYYSMPAKARMYNIKINFNLTPVLIDQIQDYETEIPCLFTEKFLRSEDKSFWEKLIKTMPYPLARRVPELQKIKEEIDRKGKTDESLKKISSLYLLTWFPEENGILTEIEQKIVYGDISDQDIKEIFKQSKGVIRKIMPEYIKLKQENRGEVSISPYYHPIIPLLIDFSSAEESSPGIKLPQRVSLKDDAEEQVKRAIEKYEKIFGEKPICMWPSEGGVSKDAIELFSKYGIKIIGTDEDVLFNSIGNRDKSLIYQKYKFGEMTIIFRDKELSDLIGFSYQHWNQKDAVADFIARLRRIYESSHYMNPVVSVILDGENCWEYYPDNGNEFIHNLYSELEKNKDWLKTADLKEIILNDDINSEELPKITAGSWIYGNFLKWIGHPEKNKFWNDVIKAKISVNNPRDKTNLLVAEGSDWFWWQGETHQPEFDKLFKANLKRFVEINS